MEDQQLFYYLSHNLKVVKKLLGEGCTFLSFSKEKVKDEQGNWSEVDAFKAIMKNDLGSKDTVITTINKPLNTLNQSDFDRLFYALNSRTYDRSRDSV